MGGVVVGRNAPAGRALGGSAHSRSSKLLFWFGRLSQMWPGVWVTEVEPSTEDSGGEVAGSWGVGGSHRTEEQLGTWGRPSARRESRVLLGP